jgi:hypothetical protein
VGCPPWREDGPVLYSHSLLSFSGLNPAELMTTSYCLIWDNILLSHTRLPQPGGPGPCIYIPQEQGGPVKPPGTGFPFFRLFRLAWLRWRYYSNPPPQGSTPDWLWPTEVKWMPSANLSWCRSPIWSPLPDFCFLSVAGFLMRHPLWREDGSVTYSYSCFWSLPEQSVWSKFRRTHAHILLLALMRLPTNLFCWGPIYFQAVIIHSANGGKG